MGLLTGLSVIDNTSNVTTSLGDNPVIHKSDFPDGFSILADVSDAEPIVNVTFSTGFPPYYTHTEFKHTYDMFKHKSWPHPPTGLLSNLAFRCLTTLWPGGVSA